MFYSLYQWELCPSVGVSEGNGASSLVSVGGIVPQGLGKGKKRAAFGPGAAVWRPLL